MWGQLGGRVLPAAAAAAAAADLGGCCVLQTPQGGGADLAGGRVDDAQEGAHVSQAHRQPQVCHDVLCRDGGG